jgi:hypothetical protein
MLFEENKLTDKTLVGTKQLLSLSLEYFIAGVSNEHCKFQEISGTKQFNESNRLSWTFLITYPFFVSLANGNSRSLFDLFSPFYSSNLGPISIASYTTFVEIKTNASPRPFKYFQNPLTENFDHVKLLNSDTSFLQVQKRLQEEILTIDGESFAFKDVKIHSDATSNSNPVEKSCLYSAIDSGIKVIQQQSGNSFFDGDIRTILHQSQFFDVLKKENQKDQLKVINYSDVGSTTLRPFYLEEAF